MSVREVADDLQVAPKTVAKWVRSGILPGISLPKGSLKNHPPIRMRRDLYESWRVSQGYLRPITPNLVLAIGPHCEVSDPDPFEVIAAPSPFSAGLAIACRYPAIVIVSASLSAEDVISIVDGCLCLPGYQPTLVAALPPALRGLRPQLPPVFGQCGFAHVMQGATGESLGMIARRMHA
jgi:hypothetical protein